MRLEVNQQDGVAGCMQPLSSVEHLKAIGPDTMQKQHGALAGLARCEPACDCLAISRGQLNACRAKPWRWGANRRSGGCAQQLARDQNKGYKRRDDAKHCELAQAQPAGISG